MSARKKGVNATTIVVVYKGSGRYDRATLQITIRLGKSIPSEEEHLAFQNFLEALRSYQLVCKREYTNNGE